MRGRFYRLCRDLHLYVGLFISPFVLVFSVSVFFLVHAWLPKVSGDATSRRAVANLPLPEGLDALSGRALIDALRPTLDAAGVRGEVGFVRHQVAEGTLVVPVSLPGRESIVTIKPANREATIVTRSTGLADAMVTLHKSPGQHLAAIRGNWIYMRAWGWAADATAYLLLFVSISGVYLWYVLRAERRLGVALLSAGAVVFFGMIHALQR
jgi:hypothetical protein